MANKIKYDLGGGQNGNDWIEITVDGKVAKIESNLKFPLPADGHGEREWNAAIDGLEALIAAMASEGAVPTKEAISNALDAIANVYG